MGTCCCASLCTRILAKTYKLKTVIKPASPNMDSGMHHGVCCDMTSLGPDTYTTSLLRDPFHRDFCEFEVMCDQCNMSACTEKIVDDDGFAYEYQLSKLTKNNVVHIFQLRLAKTPSTAGTLAEQYGVTAKAIRDIWKGRTWRRFTIDTGK